MARATVNPGICGFETVVEVQVDSATYKAEIVISSRCNHVQKLAEELGEVDAMEIITKRITETAIYQAASRAKLHAACPVPCAVIKAIEVAAGLALPAAVHIKLEKDA